MPTKDGVWTAGAVRSSSWSFLVGDYRCSRLRHEGAQSYPCVSRPPIDKVYDSFFIALPQREFLCLECLPGSYLATDSTIQVRAGYDSRWYVPTGFGSADRKKCPLFLIREEMRWM